MRTYLRLSLLCILLALPVFVQGQTNGTITLAWDTSASMADNEPIYALRYLEGVFAANPNTGVRLLEFNTGVKETNFRVSDGDWSTLKDYLKDLQYDGIALYGILSDYLGTEATYIYTDGDLLLEGDKLAVEVGNVIMSRATGESQRWLERAALIYRGEYVQLKPKDSEINASSGGAIANAEDLSLIEGTVYIDGTPSRGVLVQSLKLGEEQRTGPEGKFSMNSSIGDTLFLSGPGLEPRMIITGSDKLYNFYLNSKGIDLDEVTVTGERLEEPEMVQTAIAPRDKRRVGYAVQTIGDEDIDEIETDIVQTLLSGKFTGIELARNGQDASQFVTRQMKSIVLNNYGLIVVDGTPMGRSDGGGHTNNNAGGGGGAKRVFDTSYLDPENIASMTLLKGFVATNKYGSLGSGGVLEITTKNAVYAKSGQKPEDALKVKGNIYEDGSDPALVNFSALTELLRGVPASRRIDRYFELRAGNENDVSFYLEAYDFFKEDKPVDALRILSNVIQLAPEDPEAYFMVSLGIQELLYAGGSRPGFGGSRLQKSTEVITPAGQILATTLEKLDPQAFQGKVHQAYLKSDARLFEDNIKGLSRDYRSLKATTGLSRDYATDLGKSVTYLASVRSRDLGNEKPAIAVTGSYPARIVFEWSRPGAQFVLQSVNPQMRYYNWDHTELGEVNRLREEMQTGISLRSFDLAGAGSTGEWIFNIENAEDPALSDTPLMVGCRVYYNYGSPSVRMEYHTTTLRPGEKKQVLRIPVN